MGGQQYWVYTINLLFKSNKAWSLKQFFLVVYIVVVMLSWVLKFDGKLVISVIALKWYFKHESEKPPTLFNSVICDIGDEICKKLQQGQPRLPIEISDPYRTIQFWWSSGSGSQNRTKKKGLINKKCITNECMHLYSCLMGKTYLTV